MYFVYILQSLNGKYLYKGMTNNIERRLLQHFSGKVNSTKTKLPLQLIHVEICDNRLKVRSLEVFFKSGYGRELIREIAENLPKW